MGSRFRSKVDAGRTAESAGLESQTGPTPEGHTKGKFSLDFRAQYNPRERKLNRSVGCSNPKEKRRR